MGAFTYLGLGMAILLTAGAVVHLSKDPDRAGRRAAVALALLFAVSFAVWVARGDLFHASGLDDSAVEGCGFERVC